ncbi:hypothetical protein [Paenibacillus ginsengihumi]|uniref:hypothetical protein n=1 Tax=Paenibacillus ginsengihumi TaxID=431596 RepID=UPI0012EBFD4C|nr:hypothetical protein [Paenibacillus ginsengihumi]
MTGDNLRRRLSPAVLKIERLDTAEIFKIDTYDERFLSSSVVTFGVEKFAGGFRPIFQDRRLCRWRSTIRR